MAQSFYKIQVRDREFPMLSDQQTRTMIPIAATEFPTEQDRVGINYCHNVMPTKEGIESVAFKFIINPVDPALPEGIKMEDVRIAYAELDTTRVHICWDTDLQPYGLYDPFAIWIPFSGPLPVVPADFTINDITLATVNNITYIFYKNIGCYKIDIQPGTGVFLEPVTLIGLNIPDILGITESNGYLIAYTKTDVAWSSTINPLDFTPDPVTGAGGGVVSDIEGDIQFAISNTLGVLFFSFANTVAATYTGNIKYPFKFRAIPDGKGGINLNRVAYEADTDDIFVYSKAGMQTVTSTRADTILPEVTDFLAGKRIENYDTLTHQFETIELLESDTLMKSIKWISSRYLVISYGVDVFEFALIYDTALNRLGKIKFEHTDVFEYVGGVLQSELSKENITFLTADGSCYVLDFTTELVSDSVVILGKVAASRTRMTTLLGVEVENVRTNANLSVGTLYTLNGKNPIYAEGSQAEVDEGYQEWDFLKVGKNHSIEIQGQFEIVTAMIRYTIDGRR